MDTDPMHEVDAVEEADSVAASDLRNGASPNRIEDQLRVGMALSIRFNPVQWLLVVATAFIICYWLSFPPWIGVHHQSMGASSFYKVQTHSIFAAHDQWFAAPDILVSVVVLRVLVTLILSSMLIVLASIPSVAKGLLYALMIGMFLYTAGVLMFSKMTGDQHDVGLFGFVFIVGSVLAGWFGIIWTSVSFNKDPERRAPDREKAQISQ